MTARLSDWETPFAQYLANVAIAVALENGFGGMIGEVPCARFAAGAAQAQTGVDFYKPFRGKYKTELSAAKALKRIGAGTLEATFDHYFTARPSPAFAQRGDIIFDGESVGVCIGSDALFIGHEVTSEGKGPLALIRRPRAEWVKAWAVYDG